MIPVYALAIITRCTGPGGVRWQHVAQQLGRSVHAVRAEFDPTYLREPAPLPEPPAKIEPKWKGWTQPKVDHLKRMMGDQGVNPMTSRQIADVLGAPTSDTVLGKVWRLGMRFKKREGAQA